MASQPITLEELRDLSQEMGRSRWRLVSDAAQVVASYLSCHPKVEEVRYPGLKSDSLFTEASHMLVGGFGPVVDYCVVGDWHRLECLGEDPKVTIMRLEQELAQGHARERDRIG